MAGVGEEQLRWFAQKLEPYKERGVLRIGVVHHRIVPGPVANQDLWDADRLGHWLGGSLNLLLHGHGHDSQIGWLNPSLPVLSIGGPARAAEALPDDVPNQYQVIRIWPDRLERWTRRFDPARKRWVGDTRCSDDGRSEHIVHKAAFVSVHGTFPTTSEAEPTDRGKGRGRRPKPSAEDETTPRDHLEGERLRPEPSYSSRLIARVAELCRLRDRRVESIREREVADPPLKYLLVTASDARTVHQYPVGVFEEPVTESGLRQFLQVVVQKYRAADPYLQAVLVHAGDPVSQGLKDRAKREGIQLVDLIEYQGLLDLNGYRKRQSQRIETDPVYPHGRYVLQRMTYRIGGGATVLAESPSNDALETVTTWLTDEEGRFILVLANFGTGKTFLLRELARRLTDCPRGPIPILIELRYLQRGRTLDELIAQHLVAAGEETLDTRKFRDMLEKGRIALLFDGFDELAQRVSLESATDHFDTLLQAAAGRAKVVVTSRTHHFESDNQVRTVLLHRAEPIAGLRLCYLQPFDQTQIRAFLTRLLGDPVAAEERFQLIHDVKDLLGLSENPRMLTFIADLPAEDLRAARDRLGKITSAELYRLLLRRWLEFDVARDQPKGSAPTLTVEDRWHAVTQVALTMWSKPERTIRVNELTEALANVIENLAERHFDEQSATHLIGARSLLVRDPDGHFSFVHQSVMEWLVANAAAAQIAAEAGERHAVDALGRARMSPLMADFFRDLARESPEPWAQDVLGTVGSGLGAFAKDNAFLVLQRLGKEASLPL